MMGYWNLEDATKAVIREDGGFRTGDLGKLDEDGYVVITGRVKSQFKLSNGKYVSPAPLEENVKLSPLVEMAALDGKDMPSTFLIVYPVEEALRAHLTAQGIDASGSLEDLCGRPEVRASVLEELRSKNMEPPVWKGYEKAKHLILDPVEWTPDNNMLTPTQKVKLRNLLDRHADAIKSSGTHDGRIQAEGSVEEPDELRPIAIGCHEHRDEVVIWAHVQGFRVRDIADPTIHEPSIGHGGILTTDHRSWA